MKKTLVAVGMAGLLALTGGVLVSAAGSAATAPNVTCGPGQTLTGTYNYVTVPSTDNNSNFCTLQGATVLGQVIVQPGGTVFITQRSQIGSITSNSAGTAFGDPIGLGVPFNFSVIMCDSFVKGSLSVNGSASAVIIGSDDVNCPANTLNGSNTVNNNRGGVEIVGNTVNGDLSVNGNRGHLASGLDPDAIPNETTDVTNNSDGGHRLTCSNNVPAVNSSGNTFSVFAGGQCSP